MPALARQVYATSQLPPGEQFACWRESICAAFAALDPVAQTEARPSFDSLVEVDVFGDAGLSLVQSQPQRVVRGAAQIRRDPRERLFVNLMLAGSSQVEQGGQRCRVEAGELYVVDAAQPYVLHHPTPFTLLCLDLPRARWPRPALAQARPVRHSRVGLAMGLLRQLRDEAPHLEPADRDDTLQVACDWLMPALAAVPASAAQAGLQDLWQRASRLIDEQLRDPALSPQGLALALHVSVRYLHKAFAHQGATVSGTVRQRRLARCAAEIRRCAGRRTVAAIAQDWGFVDVPNFHRQFRRHFGHAPGQHRLPPLAG